MGDMLKKASNHFDTNTWLPTATIACDNRPFAKRLPVMILKQVCAVSFSAFPAKIHFPQ
jgi:hypothetical protein